MARSPEQLRQDLLILRAQGGDREALEELVRHWQTRFWQLAVARLGDHDAAWDVTQEAWLAILRGLWRLRQPEAFGRWAIQIVSNIAANRIRRNGRHARAMDRLARGARDRDAPTEASFERRSLSALPPAQRTVMILYYFEQKGIPEISEILGVPTGTVKSRLYYARKNLGNLLEVNREQRKEQ